MDRGTRPVHPLTVVVLALVLASCSVKAPPPVPPAIGTDLPSEWTTEPEVALVHDTAWWERVGGEPLAAVIREAVENNNDLQAAAGRIEVAIAEARVAGADLRPQISGRANGTRSRQNLTGFPEFPGLGGGDGGPLTFYTNNFGLSLNVSWEPDIWGRIRAQAGGALAQLQAQQAEYAAARLSLAGQAAKSWFALTEAGLQVELAEATVTSFEETARQATDRVEAGVQNPTDAHLATANLAQAEALLEQKRNTYQTVSRQLEILLGRYPRGEMPGASELPALPEAAPAGLPAELIARRPDLQAAERTYAAATLQTSAARKALYPALSLTGSGGTTSSGLGNLLDGDFLVWSLAGGLMQPIFQGGRLRAQVRGAEGRQVVAAEQFASEALNAFAEVETALAAEAYLRRRVTALETATEASREAVRIAENRYGQGVDPLLVVLEAQRRALDSQSALINARRQLLENRVDLHLALGGEIP